MSHELPPLSQLRLLPDDARVSLLLMKKEDQWFDRKSARIRPGDLAKTLVAMANADGGLIALGLSKGEVEGISAGDENGWRQTALDRTRPPVRHSFERVLCRTTSGAEDALALIEVEASEQVHRTAQHEVYLRVGDEDRRLRDMEVVELEYDKGQAAYDGRVAIGTNTGDLEDPMVAAYAEAIGPHMNTIEALAARGLLRIVDGEARPTNAGILVLGRDPQLQFPEGFVRILEHQGRTREVGERSNVLADHRLQGPLPDQIDAAQHVLRDRIPAVIRLGRSGRFGPSPIVPEFAWLEAVVNAVVHRSYSMAGDHIRVEIFEDRLEVESPGRLPGLVRVENIRSTRFARNPRVARAMADLGYARELGEGVDRMFEEMQRAGLPDPEYQQLPGSVRVVLLANPALSRLFEDLPPALLRLAQYINRAGTIRTAEALQVLGVSRPTAIARLRQLADRGVVEHVGSSPNDPTGYWRLRS